MCTSVVDRLVAIGEKNILGKSHKAVDYRSEKRARTYCKMNPVHADLLIVVKPVVGQNHSRDYNKLEVGEDGQVRLKT